MRLQLIMIVFILTYALFQCTEPIKPTTPAALLDNMEWLASSSPYGSPCSRIMDDKIIYIDPASLAIKENTPKADFIFVTHSHSDHFSVSTIRQLCKETTRIVTTLECEDVLVTRAPDDPWKISVVAAGDKLSLEGMEIEAFQAYNDVEQPSHVKDVGVGLVIGYRGVRLYISGDTGYIPEMKDIHDIDIAVFYVRKLFCMSGEDCVKAANTFNPTYVIPVHFSAQDQPEVEYLSANCPSGTSIKMLQQQQP
jgi:L-ascorbate metabolism protein UlaG (beta-lactamase superfamily)